MKYNEYHIIIITLYDKYLKYIILIKSKNKFYLFYMIK